MPAQPQGAYNAFDFLDVNVSPQTPEEKEEMQAKAKEIDELIVDIFVRTEAGRRLLKIWMRALITNPVVRAGEKHDQFDIGINQGTLDFIRKIVITCEIHLKGKIGDDVWMK